MITLKFFKNSGEQELVSCLRFNIMPLGDGESEVTAYMTPSDHTGVAYIVGAGEWGDMYAENLSGKTTHKVSYKAH